MSVILGGSNGITYNNGSNDPATGITAKYSPYITDSSNVMVVSGRTSVDGVGGVTTPLGTIGSARPQLSYTFSANTANASLNVTSISGYSAGLSDITITVNSGIYLYSTSVSNAGLALSGGTTGDTITLVNNGYIMGQGGAGGSGVSAGNNGGTALSLGFNTTVNNTNASAYIGGGGGGGGADAAGGGGGAGGGNGGSGYYGLSGGSGGSVGSTGSNGNGDFYTHGGYGGGAGGGGGAYSVECQTCNLVGVYSGGGGGGRIFPGTGGAGGTGNNTNGLAGGSANNAGGSLIPGPAQVGAGGGGWGASGGTSYTYTGGSGGKAVALNAHTVTWVSGNTTRVYGAVA